MSGGRAQRPIRMINVHAEGELGYVVTEGLPDIPGKTIADRLAALNAGDGILRRHLMLAPRAKPACSVNLLMPPVDPRADVAFIILQPDRAHASSGSNSICVTTALLETGRMRMKEPETTVVLETAAGLVTARAECRNGKCLRVHLDMVPAFVESLDVPLETGKWGTITADICYGGVFYALVDVETVGLSVRPDHAAALSLLLGRASSVNARISTASVPYCTKIHPVSVQVAGTPIPKSIQVPGPQSQNPYRSGEPFLKYIQVPDPKSIQISGHAVARVAV